MKGVQMESVSGATVWQFPARHFVKVALKNTGCKREKKEKSFSKTVAVCTVMSQHYQGIRYAKSICDISASATPKTKFTGNATMPTKARWLFLFPPEGMPGFLA